MADGSKGANASPCNSTATDVGIGTYLHRDVSALEPMYSLNSFFWIENRVKDNRCFTKYVKTTAHIPSPSPRKPLKFIPSVIEYKSFLQKNMKKSALLETGQKVYDAIGLNPDISRAYSVADFVLELNALEERSYKIGEDVDFLPFYDNFLKRIESYAIANQN